MIEPIQSLKELREDISSMLKKNEELEAELEKARAEIEDLRYQARVYRIDREALKVKLEEVRKIGEQYESVAKVAFDELYALKSRRCGGCRFSGPVGSSRHSEGMLKYYIYCDELEDTYLKNFGCIHWEEKK